MPRARKTISPKKARARSVEVRVVRNKPNIVPAAPQLKSDPELSQSKVVRPVLTRVRLARPRVQLWVGVVASFVVIVAAWLIFSRLAPGQKGPTEADLVLANLGKTLSNFADEAGQDTNKIKQALDEQTRKEAELLELRELEQKVFSEFY